MNIITCLYVNILEKFTLSINVIVIHRKKNDWLKDSFLWLFYMTKDSRIYLWLFFLIKRSCTERKSITLSLLDIILFLTKKWNNCDKNDWCNSMICFNRRRKKTLYKMNYLFLLCCNFVQSDWIGNKYSLSICYFSSKKKIIKENLILYDYYITSFWSFTQSNEYYIVLLYNLTWNNRS